MFDVILFITNRKTTRIYKAAETLILNLHANSTNWSNLHFTDILIPLAELSYAKFTYRINRKTIIKTPLFGNNKCYKESHFSALADDKWSLAFILGICILHNWFYNANGVLIYNLPEWLKLSSVRLTPRRVYLENAAIFFILLPHHWNYPAWPLLNFHVFSLLERFHVNALTALTIVAGWTMS